jgi:hypothetical protein
MDPGYGLKGTAVAAGLLLLACFTYAPQALGTLSHGFVQAGDTVPANRIVSLILSAPATVSTPYGPAAQVVGGLPLDAHVTIAFMPRPGQPVELRLESSDPAVLVPDVILMTHRVLSFPVNTPAVNSSRDARITGRLGAGPVTHHLRLRLERVPQPSLVRLDSARTVGGWPVNAAVHVDLPLPESAGGFIELKSSDPGVATVAATASVGGAFVAFRIMTRTVTARHSVLITATGGGVSRSAVLTVEPLALEALVLDSAAVVSGRPVGGLIVLNGPAPQPVHLQVAADDAAIVPMLTDVVVPAGQSQHRFTLNTRRVQQPRTVTLRASLGSARMQRVFTLLPAPAPGTQPAVTM